MLFSLLIREFPFNEKFDGVFKNTYNEDSVSVVASGSTECFFPEFGKDILTKPESAIDPEDKLEWCSNINRSKTDYPWISTVFKNKKLSLSGYSIKSGCCKYSTDGCCCLIYSWSILGSNDNKTWTKLHSVRNDLELGICKEKSFQVDKKGSFSMFKIIQDEPEPGCWYCIALSKLELYGTLSDYNNDNGEEVSNEDEVSIIGRIKKAQ